MTDVKLDRRTALVSAGATLAALAAGGCSLGKDEKTAAAAATTTAKAPEGWKGVRGLFELDPEMVHLTTFVFAAHPKPVRDAIEKHRAEFDKNPAVYLRQTEPGVEEAARQAAADYLESGPEQVALTDSTTMGLGLVYSSLRLKEGEEVVTTEHDFYSTHESLRLRAESDGAKVRRLKLYDDPADASVDQIVSTVRDGLGPRTRCLAITWVHSGTGVKLPVRQIADVVAEANDGRSEEERILLAVDGVHGFGNQDVSPNDLGADILVSGCHKWLFGPRGTGFVWGHAPAWARLHPTIPSFDTAPIVGWLGFGTDPGQPGPVNSPGGYHSFDHRWALPEAFSLHAELGRSEVAARTEVLATRLKEGLSENSQVTLATPIDPELSAGLVCLDAGGRQPGEIVDLLREEHQVVASVTPYATEYVRFGPSIVNSEEDVDAAVAAVNEIL